MIYGINVIIVYDVIKLFNYKIIICFDTKVIKNHAVGKNKAA